MTSEREPFNVGDFVCHWKYKIVGTVVEVVGDRYAVAWDELQEEDYQQDLVDEGFGCDLENVDTGEVHRHLWRRGALYSWPRQ